VVTGAKQSVSEERSDEFDCGLLQGVENSECSKGDDFSFASFLFMAGKERKKAFNIFNISFCLTTKGSKRQDCIYVRVNFCHFYFPLSVGFLALVVTNF
jgi:hypothetical protein